MEREENQPVGEAVQRPYRDMPTMRQMCGDTVALIVATETETTPLVVRFDDPDSESVTCEPADDQAPVARPLQLYQGKPAVYWAVKAAIRAQVGLVYVLSDPSISREVAHAAHSVRRRKNDPFLQVIDCDRKSLIDRTRQAGNIELFGVPYSVLEIAKALVDSGVGGYASAIIMSADTVRIEADHIYELCEDARQHPDADVIASWIEQLRRPPYLFSQEFLINLCQGVPDPPDMWGFAPVEAPRAEGPTPVWHYKVRDHVFGEEKLAANAVERRQVAHALEKCGITALQAVHIAKREGKGVGKRPAAPRRPQAPAAAIAAAAPRHPQVPMRDAASTAPVSAAESKEPKSPVSPTGTAESAGVVAAADSSFVEATRSVDVAALNNVERMLVDIALDTRKALDAESADDAAELEWADDFGMRTMRDFPLLNDPEHAGKLAYLDSAATTQRADAALQAQLDFDVRGNANIYRGGYPLSKRSTRAFDDARSRLEAFIGAERNSVVFTANATGAINLVAQAWGEHNIGEEDLILVALSDHHSNTLPFLMLAERKGAIVEHVPYDERGHIDQAAYAEALARKPKLVCVAQIGNMFGMLEPVREMAQAAHAAGARFLVDAAQSFAHAKLDVADLGADWVAFSAHKAYGPMGIGGLWVSPDAFAEMKPLGGGGGTVTHVGVDSYCLRPGPQRYEMGTPPVSQAIGWAAAIGYLDGLGMENVERHSAALTRYAVRGLQRIDGVRVVGDHFQPDGQTGLVSFTLRSVAPAQLAAFLGKLGVAIRSGGHCALPVHAALGLIGTGRISIGVHTTRDDIDAALAAIELCRRAYEA